MIGNNYIYHKLIFLNIILPREEKNQSISLWATIPWHGPRRRNRICNSPGSALHSAGGHFQVTKTGQCEHYVREFNRRRFWRTVYVGLSGKLRSRDSRLTRAECLVPSKTSTGTSCTNCSHHLRYMGLEVHSCISNLHKRPARYITATAMISGSHCSDKVVQRLVQREKEVTWLKWANIYD